jgi:hypothetical protein
MKKFIVIGLLLTVIITVMACKDEEIIKTNGDDDIAPSVKLLKGLHLTTTR